MDTQIKQYRYSDGTLQRVQIVRPESWDALSFLHPDFSEEALTCFSDIYKNHLVPACPVLFGTMVMFYLPEDVDIPFSFRTKKYGTVADRLTAAAAALEEGVRMQKGIPHFRNDRIKAFWKLLERRDCIRVIRGLQPVTTIIPLGPNPGFLTRTKQDAALKVNASFFIMDRFDCATLYDHIGTVLGLCVKDGIVTNPPLYRREALLVKKDGSVSVTMPMIRDMDIQIGEQVFRHGKNCRIYTRPRFPVTPPGRGTRLVIVGCKVAAVSKNRTVPVPASGFVLCTKEDLTVEAGTAVVYKGMEDVAFGIQVGNSIVRSGEKTLSFVSRFYNIRRLQPVPYPPSLYPMDFDNATAARIALGADADGKPILLWAEGAAKFGYEPGKGSRGASLKDMAMLCADAGMVNAVNLDGGGSAQILLKNKRSLLISDRNPKTLEEVERPIPLALTVE